MFKHGIGQYSVYRTQCSFEINQNYHYGPSLTYFNPDQYQLLFYNRQPQTFLKKAKNELEEKRIAQVLNEIKAYYLIQDVHPVKFSRKLNNYGMSRSDIAQLTIELIKKIDPNFKFGKYYKRSIDRCSYPIKDEIFTIFSIAFPDEMIEVAQNNFFSTIQFKKPFNFDSKFNEFWIDNVKQIRNRHEKYCIQMDQPPPNENIEDDINLEQDDYFNFFSDDDINHSELDF